MTRDEAKQDIINYQIITYDVSDYVITVNDAIDTINQVYDGFESRTCENCKYFTSSPNTNKYDCCEKGIADTSISFCCNKWESK